MQSQNLQALAPIDPRRIVSAEREAQIVAKLRTATTAELGQQLQHLLSQFPNIRDDGAEASAARATGYVVALQGFGIATVKALVVAVLQNRGGFRPGFLPLAPELAAWCREHERFDRDLLAKQAKAAGQLALRDEIEEFRTADPDARTRVLRGFDGLKDELLKSASEAKLRQAEKAEYHRRKEENHG